MGEVTGDAVVVGLSTLDQFVTNDPQAADQHGIGHVHRLDQSDGELAVSDQHWLGQCHHPGTSAFHVDASTDTGSINTTFDPLFFWASPPIVSNICDAIVSLASRFETGSRRRNATLGA